MKRFRWFAIFIVPFTLLVAIPSWPQPSDAYELACPSGYDPMPAYGKTFNSQTGRWRANLCISNSGSGTMVCQMNGCGAAGVTITTVAGLNSVSGKTKGTVAAVTNGTSATDCTVGGGTTQALCQYTGAAWVPIAGTSLTLQTNGVPNTSQAGLNVINSTANAVGLTLTCSNPAAANEQCEIAGVVNLASAPVNTGLIVPTAPGAAPTAAGTIAFDSTANQPVAGSGTGTQKLIPLIGAAPSSGNCTKFSVTGTQVGVQDAGYTCAPPSAIPTQVVQSGLMAEYRLTEGSGTTLTDFSGNGNNATFPGGAANPTWITTSGLQFSGAQYVNLPAALNTAVTFQIMLGFQFTGAGTYNTLVGASAGAPACPVLFLDNQHNLGITGSYFHFEEWGTSTYGATYNSTAQGISLVSWALGSGGTGYLAINGNALTSGGNVPALAAGTFRLGQSGAGGGCPGVADFLTGQIYYVVVYNRALSQAELTQNYEFLQNVMAARGQFMFQGTTSTTDQVVLEGDSETYALTNSTFFLTPTVNVMNISVSGTTMAQIFARLPNDVAPLVPTLGMNRQLITVWGGTNDYGGGLVGVLAYAANYCRTAHKLGYKCVVVDLMDKTGFDSTKNSYNISVRANWTRFADAFIDIGADPNLGCDACAGNTTYMSGGLHPTSASNYNIVAPYFQRVINRFYGNNEWSTATIYASPAPAATAITAASEAGNTVTITSTLNPPVGSCAVVSGVTPAGYNNVSGECWAVLTTSATNFTYYNFVTGLGAGTVFGTASVPLQKDVDVYSILNFGAGNFTLEPCGGYTGQKIYIKNINAGASTVVPFGNDLIDAASSISVAQNAVLVLQAQLPNSGTPQCSWVKVQNN